MRIYVFIFSIILLFSGCRKKDPDAIGAVYLFPQEVKDYTLFLPGTYWIYQDSISGIEDSVYVINYSAGIDTIEINSDNTGKEVVEFFQYDTKSSYYIGVYRYSSNTSFSDKCVDNNEQRPCFWMNRSNFKGSGFCFLYEFYEGFFGRSGFASTYSIITIVKHWSLFKVNNVTYYDVVKFNDNKNITENDNKTNFFFAKNIGIVRKELLDSNQTWNLIRSNIIQ